MSGLELPADIMTLKHLSICLLVAVLIVGSSHIAHAQSVTCSLSVPLGPTAIATGTGHTEPIAAGPNALPPTPGGGTVRVTCVNSGGAFTADVGALTISFGTVITNTTAHPSISSGIRVSNGSGAFVTGGSANVGISNVNHSGGAVTIGLGTPTATPSAPPTTGITFPPASASSFDLNGVLVSVIGKVSVSASLSIIGTGYSANAGTVAVITAVSAGLVNPTVPASLPPAVPPGSSGGPAVVTANGTVVKGNFTIRIQENYAAMLRDWSQFNGGTGGVFPQSPSSDVQLMIQFYSIPIGFDISACSAVVTNINGASSTGFPSVNFTNVTPANPILIINFNSALDLSTIDVVWLTCTNVNKGSAILPLSGPDITAQVTLAPVGAALSNTGGPLTTLIQGQVPRYQALWQPPTPITAVSIPLPSITGITPSSALPGSEVLVEITGMRLAGASQILFSGTGISADILDASDSTVLAQVTIQPTATPGPRTVWVTTGEGTSLPFSSFTVLGEVKKRSGQLTAQ
jgi:hypothetical protein